MGIANFTLPSAAEMFSSIEYVGLNEEEADKLVQVYNKEGADNRLNLIIDKRNKKKLACILLFSKKANIYVNYEKN